MPHEGADMHTPAALKTLGMTGISKSQISRLCGVIDGKVHTFLNRPLEGEWSISGWTQPT